MQATFNQQPAPTGSLFGKAIHACFGGNASKAKVVAVINRANWCLICQQNAERIQSLLPLYKDKPIAFVANDITDDHSKAISGRYLKKLHLDKSVEPIKESGIIILLDARTHKVMGQISLASSSEEIENAINRSLNTTI